ncbi:hypothetical protein I4F81_006400 [Pyropia yezoensis]|uniref:Uncharacterized protein n=1 Tax=Pyropia yezoensis TaxID=2788 RepID=A0ACC3C1L8_PYRYE|nr:hypothetical protein I4F81_006400 [Neopyropia yezoensis]
MSTVSSNASTSSSAPNHCSTATERSLSDTPSKSSHKRLLAIKATTSETSVWTLSATGTTPCSCRRTSAAALSGKISAVSQQLASYTAATFSHSSAIILAASLRMVLVGGGVRERDEPNR